MKIKSIFWIIVILLLLPSVYAGDAIEYTAQEITDAIILNLPWDTSVTEDVSSEGRTCTDNGGATIDTNDAKIGAGHLSVTGAADSRIDCNVDAHMGAVLNLTVCFWDNTTDTSVDQYPVRAKNSADAGWRFIWRYNGLNTMIFSWASTTGSADSLATRVDFFADATKHLVCGVANWTGDGSVYVYMSINGTPVDAGGSMVETMTALHLDPVQFGVDGYDGHLDDFCLINLSLTTQDIKEFIWDESTNGGGLPCKLADAAGEATFTNNKNNNSIPRQNEDVQINITITNTVSNVSGYTFSTDNGTLGRWFNLSFEQLPEPETITNASVNMTLYNASGVTYQWRWWANDSTGVWTVSDTYSLTVGGTTPPNITVNPNNFFNAQNTTYLALNVSEAVIFNLTFEDDVDLFGFNITITAPNGVVIWNLTNTSLNGSKDNFTLSTTSLIETYAFDGNHTVKIVTWDSHTSTAIEDYDVEKGKDYLLFDSKIRITADKAVSASTKKYTDKYTFEFTYSKLFTPKTKKFYVESDGKLTHKTVGYKAHFVDWESKRWIDFEGMEGEPIVTKINDYKWRVEFANEDDVAIFNSIGGLNSGGASYIFYLVNPSLNWTVPAESPSYFTNSTFTVALNVTSDYRNLTQFWLFNSSHDLVEIANVSNTSSGSYNYSYTFSGLNDTTYYVNATHWTLANSSVNSTTLTFSSVFFNLTFYDEVTDTLMTDIVNVEFVGDEFYANYSTNNSFVLVMGWAFEEYRITYDSDKYRKRDYYITPTNISNTVLRLYLLSTTNGTDVTFTVQDNSGNELAESTIWLKKYYVTTNSYRTVAMVKTNEEGEAVIDVDYNDAYYQILVTYEDYSLQTIGTRIISTTRILTMDLIPDPFTHIDVIDDITTSLTFNNLTQTFSYTFTDTTGSSRTGLLEVYRTTPTLSDLVCTNTDTSSSATLLCQVNTTNVTGTYTAKGYIQLGSKDMNILMEMLQVFTGLIIELKQTWGTQGIFFTILVAGTLAGLGAVISPAVGIIMFLVGLVMVGLLGMSIISGIFIGFFILIGFVTIWMMKK